MQYRRAYQPGGRYFFTVVTHRRQKLLTPPENIIKLRQAFRHVMNTHPFTIDAIVILADHLHCLWQLPGNDADFSTRWMLIKRHFSIQFHTPTQARREKAIWQLRFWEHLIRDEEDWQKHMDYIHYNPVKHGYVKQPAEWAYSSFQRAVKQGLYHENWGMGEEPKRVRGMELE
ncbi:hypothetical protein THII_1103 [Thioploca ingrica]|uniref:Transposase IS200-like domain-containing protein n=1 Tax=Thioploca ingrica TaxID=40754 RepID=A0A090AK76_9GAMM|nr:hypothetical protein THII_1103 [Thioploca ingrica]